MKKPKLVNVPCGDCTLCCQNDLIFLHPEMGDRFSDFSSHVHRMNVGGNHRWALNKNPDGTCVYLRDGRCTTHHNKPVVCREFDCRGLVQSRIIKDPYLRQFAGADVVAMGRVLLEFEGKS